MFKFRKFVYCIALAFMVYMILRVSELVAHIKLLNESVSETCTKHEVYKIVTAALQEQKQNKI